PHSFPLLSSRSHRDLQSFPTRRSSDLHGVLPVDVLLHHLSRNHRRFPGADAVDQKEKPAPAGGHDRFRNRSATSIRIAARGRRSDRKSTRLNSSHVAISYAVFCLKKKT